MRVPWRMASEFCEMVTPCGNGPARMGALASVGSAQENAEVYSLVASFSQDNQMENDVWLGWNTINPFFWEDGTPAYPNGFQAFGSLSPGMPAASGWPVTRSNPFASPPGAAPVMKRQPPSGPPGPEWDLHAVTELRAFVCEVPAGVTVQNPGMGGQPGVGGQPGMGGQPGSGNQPGVGGNPMEPTIPTTPNAPANPNAPINPNAPATPNNPNPRLNRPRMLNDVAK